MLKIRQIIIGIFVAMLLTNISSAAVELTVTPVDAITVVQGETISYIATVTMTDSIFYPPLEEVFSIEDADKQLGWTYTFDSASVILVNVGDSNSSTLTITVPIDAPTGLYSHTVIATGYDQFGNIIGIPITFPIEVDYYDINTDVTPIPEFPTIALPVISVLGIMLLMSRREENH
ncbi:MAG TPA: PEF-CTERM sorting domain-containing protein [Methanosarcinaceae archaeon]|nr:PEF-CTERM sorting domain-containing protein [Methanosarcinaceae archaeon]